MKMGKTFAERSAVNDGLWLLLIKISPPSFRTRDVTASGGSFPGIFWPSAVDTLRVLSRGTSKKRRVKNAAALRWQTGECEIKNVLKPQEGVTLARS